MEGVEPFGVVLRGLRQRAWMTMEELAGRSGVSVRAIGDMERGRSRVPQRRTVVALAEGLGLGEAERDGLVGAARAARPVREAGAGGGMALPRTVGDFTGRERELARLRAHAAAGAPVVVVSGPPGCGKTTLALHAAAELADGDPCLVADLHGVDGAVATDEVLLRLLKALGVPDHRLPAEEAERAGLLRELLAERRCLVVLDNARDEAQVRALLPAAGPSLVLVTSRRPLTGLADVARLPLAVMTRDEAGLLLRRILGEARAGAEPENVARLVELCGRLPLALRVAANWLTVRSGWRVEQLVRRLADEERRLGALSAGDVRVEAAFELSYRQLTGQAARMLRLLGLVPVPDPSADYAAALTATEVSEAEDVLEELVEAGLLQATYTGRYQLHDLLRLFGRSRPAPEGEREAAEERLRTWLLDTATAAGRRFKPGYDTGPTDHARAWLQQEAPAWLAALRDAAARGEYARVVETADAMEWFCGMWVFWGHWPEVFRLSSEAAGRLGDPKLRAVHINCHCWSLLACESRYREAVGRAGEALECARRAGDLAQQASALAHAAWGHEMLGEYERAADTSRASLELYEKADDRAGWVQALITYGSTLRLLGRPEEALAEHGRVIAFLDAPDCPVGEHVADLTRTHASLALGLDHGALRRWEEAAGSFRDAVARSRRTGLAHAKGQSLVRLGEALAELGEVTQARECLREALALGDETDTVYRELARELLESLG
ncbi:Regulatory protein AfsR [Streptomyces sp. RB5]|uniref:Regulatory protein AfsR n=1 Tax=Streptomyces smaragdinus TaxID=2585196 RepID=A0A7K0CLC9_9ACTN|nr:helix-turn-helix domain-containing protein [Streptomyces smaragdinus]MQY14290.1 Regulatory protein AfsR [Streptomyces smaragdinus]